MLLFPAIDILGGRSVRLLRGEREKVTDYGSPLDRAEMFIKAGAKRLHVVDLDGAFGGEGVNLEIIKQIAAAGIFVQTGGGIRSLNDIESRLGSGIARVILGTAAVQNPDLVKRAVKEFGGGRLACGIDVKNGKVAVKGWTETADISAAEFGKRLKELGVETVIYTDISRDGALTGVNAEGCAVLARETGLSVIASGGVKDMEDLRVLNNLGVYGAILGKAIYTGGIDLAGAQRVYPG